MVNDGCDKGGIVEGDSEHDRELAVCREMASVERRWSEGFRFVCSIYVRNSWRHFIHENFRS